MPVAAGSHRHHHPGARSVFRVFGSLAEFERDLILERTVAGLAEFGGHGIGSTMHQDPHVGDTGRPNRGYRLRPGLLLALEPWVMADTAELTTDADGWILRSATGCRTAHSIAITDDRADILTSTGTRGQTPGSDGGPQPVAARRSA